MTKVSFIKRIVPVVVVASVASMVFLAGCSCTPTEDVAGDETVVEGDTVVVEPEDVAVIGTEKAKIIALEAAGVDEADAKNLLVTANDVDGVPAYEVTFDVDGATYEYVIDANSGDILEFVSVVEGGSEGGSGSTGGSGTGSGTNSGSGSNSGSNSGSAGSTK